MTDFTPEQVKEYYNKTTPSFLEIYGDVIQAFRPSDTEKLLDYVGRSAGLNWGLRVLDVGCGVAGPAIHFVKRWNVTVDGVTISEVQFNEGKAKIQQALLQDKIKLHLGDYHQLDNAEIKDNFYDVVIFLESLGHSDDVTLALQQTAAKLKTGGSLYVKDFYKKQSEDSEQQRKIDKVIQNINHHYAYNTLDLEEVKGALKVSGFEIEFIRPLDFADDTAIRYNFESRNKIDIFEGGPEFYPADWLEIKCIKI